MPTAEEKNTIRLMFEATNKTRPVIKQVADDVQGLETNLDNTSNSAEGMNNQFMSAREIAMAYSSAIGIVTAGLGAMVALFNAGEIAAGNERLITSGEQLAQSYDSSLDSILNSVKETSLGTVSEMDIIASANKAMMLGVSGSAEQLSQLMEIAALRGRAMGISTTQAFDDMVRGIGRMSPMILDNLGIVVDSEGTYKKYAESIGKTSGELTRAEKIQALLNSVIEEGNRLLEESGGLAEDNAAHYERWNAELENTKNALFENTIEMSRFADMGASLLSSFNESIEGQNISELWFRNATGVNLYNTAIGFLEDRVRRGKEEQYAALDATEAHGEALMGVVTSVQAVAEAEQAVAIVHGEAVKGAMQVQAAYERYGEKLQDLKFDHDELTAKKQALLDQGYYPEHSAIQTLNERLAENEQKQLDVTTAMQGTLEQMILNTAMAGLDAEAQLALARATGQIDESTYAALSAQMLIKKQYEDGTITADEYAKKTLELRDAVNSLTDNNVTVTVNGIFNEIRNVMTNYASSNGGAQLVNRYAEGTDGWQVVPPGYPNDTYPIMVQSGERFAVIPAGVNAMPSPTGAGGGFGGGGFNVTLVVQSPVTIMDEENARNVLLPLIESGIKELQSRGAVV